LKDMENFTSKGTASLCPRMSSTKSSFSTVIVSEEEEWDPDNGLIDKLNLLDLGEELKEHNSDDIKFYHDSSNDDNEEEGFTKH
jgi:hypothetical protein